MTPELEQWIMRHENTEMIKIQRVNDSRFVVSAKQGPCVVETLADLQVFLGEFYRSAGEDRRREYRERMKK